MGDNAKNLTADLNAMLGNPTIVNLHAGEVAVKPITLRQFNQLLVVLPTAVADLFGTFDGFSEWARESGLADAESGELRVSTRDLGPALQKLFAQSTGLPRVMDQLVQVIGIASEKPREWVEGLDLADVAALGMVLWETNADFFVQSVWPAVTRRMSPTSGNTSTRPESRKPNGEAPAGRASFNA